MRRALLCLVPAVLFAAADPDPAAFVPEDAVLGIRAPDLERTRARWAASPYAALAATVWGRTAVSEWGGRLERSAPGAGQLLSSLGSAAGGVVMLGAGRPAVTVALRGDAPLLRLATSRLLPASSAGIPTTFRGRDAGGRATLHGGVLAWCSEPGDALQPVAAVRPPDDAEADLEVRLDLGRWTGLLGLQGSAAATGVLRADLRLDRLGVRETISLEPGAALREAAVAVRRWADPEELRRLPATTLWAATWTADPALAGLLLPPEGDPALARFEAMLADAGLPGWRETLLAMDGPAVVCMSEGMPFPAVTCALSLPQPIARRWIAAAAQHLNLVQTEGAFSGFVGLLPVAMAWIPEDGGGRLVATTDPGGLDAWRQRRPGFAEHPGVRTTLAEVQERTLLLGAGRGGASWAALAQLAVPVFTAMGAPQAVSLPGDLRAANDRGWLHLRLDRDGTLRVDAAGLAGGPLAFSSVLGAAVPATMWLQGEQQRQQRRQARQRAEPEEVPAAPQAPVF